MNVDQRAAMMSLAVSYNWLSKDQPFSILELSGPWNFLCHPSKMFATLFPEIGTGEHTYDTWDVVVASNFIYCDLPLDEPCEAN